MCVSYVLFLLLFFYRKMCSKIDKKKKTFSASHSNVQTATVEAFRSTETNECMNSIQQTNQLLILLKIRTHSRTIACICLVCFVQVLITACFFIAAYRRDSTILLQYHSHFRNMCSSLVNDMTM